MKSLFKKILYTFLLITSVSYSSFAVNVVDSDLSNTAGSNSGHSNATIYAFIVIFLILAATAPFYDKKAKKSSNEK
ncbi:hypothetical protein [Arcticibacter svalbardensis]|uniref:hypothetical protein n=1 Tax=Arcticibacter svalbardensis TaxID=1288027 RepID=UPI00058EE5B5|nr:hypothetical protein [Arcticibacter svalbardensis]